MEHVQWGGPDTVVVCGGGLAGLTAAVTAQEQGARVLLLEKAPQAGGTTVLSGGLLWTLARYEEARSKIPFGDAALQWLVYDSIDDARAWLRSLGAKMGPVEEPVLGHGRGQTVDPVEMIQLLHERFLARGGTVLLNTALASLDMSAGVVTGVQALTEGRLVTVRACAVVMATGGFQGNPELLLRYIVRPENLVLRANRWSTGDGFLAATSVGAAASPGLDTFYGHALAAGAKYGKAQLRDISQYHGRLSVAINLLGERFTDETEETGDEALNQHLARQPQGRGFYIVDESAMEQVAIQGREAITRTILRRAVAAGGTVIEADTLEDLCAALSAHGVPPSRALATLRDYNAHIESGQADALVPSRVLNRVPLAQPPYRAVMVQAAITFTMGGLLIDERTRVLWRAGTSSTFAAVPVERAYIETDGPAVSVGEDFRQMPIRGLYAAGNDAGNISNFGYMGGLASALTTGRMAGSEAGRMAVAARASQPAV